MSSEDHLKNPGPEPRFVSMVPVEVELNPEDLLVPAMLSDDWPETYCPASRPGYSKATGVPCAIAVDCKRWRCKRCAISKTQRVLKHAWSRFQGLDWVWWGRLVEEGTTLSTLRKRKERAKASDLWVKRDGYIYWFSDEDLSDSPIGEISGRLPPIEALDHLRGSVLMLPGVSKVGWDDIWRPDEHESKGFFRAPLKSTSREASDHVIAYVRSRLKGGGEIADGTTFSNEEMDQLFYQGYHEFQKSKERRRD